MANLVVRDGTIDRDATQAEILAAVGPACSGPGTAATDGLMTSADKGKLEQIGIYRGAYAFSYSLFAVGDVVLASDGAQYIATAPTNTDPDGGANSSYWAPYVPAGAPGATGPSGLALADGVYPIGTSGGSITVSGGQITAIA